MPVNLNRTSLRSHFVPILYVASNYGLRLALNSRLTPVRHLRVYDFYSESYVSYCSHSKTCTPYRIHSLHLVHIRRTHRRGTYTITAIPPFKFNRQDKESRGEFTRAYHSLTFFTFRSARAQSSRRYLRIDHVRFRTGLCNGKDPLKEGSYGIPLPSRRPIERLMYQVSLSLLYGQRLPGKERGHWEEGTEETPQRQCTLPKSESIKTQAIN